MKDNNGGQKCETNMKKNRSPEWKAQPEMQRR